MLLINGIAKIYTIKKPKILDESLMENIFSIKIKFKQINRDIAKNVIRKFKLPQNKERMEKYTICIMIIL